MPLIVAYKRIDGLKSAVISKGNTTIASSLSIRPSDRTSAMNRKVVYCIYNINKHSIINIYRKNHLRYIDLDMTFEIK